MATQDPELRRTEVNGIPALWIDGPRPFTAALSFRVGYYDERLATHGITHLVEHLALYPLRDTEIAYNGSVGPHLTVFWAQGNPDKVGHFLRRLCDSLQALDYSRLEVEAQVLEREAAGRNHWLPVHDVQSAYFGLRGPGLVGAYEYGLSRVMPDALDDWSGSHFTAGNAMLTIVGKPPVDWGLSLPAGERVPFGALQVQPLPSGATLLGSQSGGLIWGSLVDVEGATRHPGLSVGLAILSRRVEDRIRHEMGQTYAVGFSASRVDRLHDLCFIGFDTAAELARPTAVEFNAVVHDFLEGGPTREEIQRHVRTVEAHYEDRPREVALDELYSRSESDLVGWEPFVGPSQHVEQLRHLEPETVLDEFQRAYSRSYTVADQPPLRLLEHHRQFPPNPAPRPGARYVVKFGHRHLRPHVVNVGGHGIDVGYPDGWLTVDTDRIEAVSIEEHRILVFASPRSWSLDTGKYHRVSSEALWVALLWLLWLAGVAIGLRLDHAWPTLLGIPLVWRTWFAVFAAPGTWRGASGMRASLEESIRRAVPPDLIFPPRRVPEPRTPVLPLERLRALNPLAWVRGEL